MKKLVSLIFASLIVLNLVACGGNAIGNVKSMEDARPLNKYDIKINELTYNDIDVVKFGNYPQSDETSGKSEPIYWIVIGKNEDERLIYLMSKDILDASRYDASGEKHQSYYNDLEVAKFLNNSFLNTAFSTEEKITLQDIGNKYDEHMISTYWPLGAGSDISRCVELLKAKPTKYALRTIIENGREYSMGMNKKTKTGDWWFTTRVIPDDWEVDFCNYDGIINKCLASSFVGVRPFICVKY